MYSNRKQAVASNQTRLEPIESKFFSKRPKIAYEISTHGRNPIPLIGRKILLQQFTRRKRVKGNAIREDDHYRLLDQMIFREANWREKPFLFRTSCPSPFGPAKAVQIRS